jgi:hypothetical protein
MGQIINRFMKLILIISFALLGLAGAKSQNTIVPDTVFEQFLIDSGIDTGLIDGIVPTASINSVTSLTMLFLNITDLTGIEDFSGLESIRCAYSQLTKIDLSMNYLLSDIKVDNNLLDTLILPSSNSLIELSCGNNLLSELNVSSYVNLELLYCLNNLITHLDLSYNSQLHALQTYNNPLLCLNVKNGNNINMTSFGGGNSPDLICIEVDSADWATLNWSLSWVGSVLFSESCKNSCSSGTVGFTEQPKISKKLIRIIDLFGNKSKVRKNELLIYIYNDGSVEKKYHY